MNWQARIMVDPAILVGKPVIRGTRISVELVIDLLAGGWSREDILAEYGPLEPADIEASLAYARDVLKSGAVYATIVASQNSNRPS